MIGNPLLDEFLALDDDQRADPARRDELIARYAFAIPDDTALDLIVDLSPSGVVELAAGTGYWARLLHERSASVRAYDLHPPSTPTNKWFATSEPWFEVEAADETVVDHAPPATLLLVWPTRNETWASTAIERFHDAGGTTIVYVGEGPGGRTGDDGFHAALGELTECTQCRYGALDAPCICDIPVRWRRCAEHAIPTWPGFHDALRVYERLDAPVARDGRRARRRGLMRRARRARG